jgi:hypothetical protein
MAQFETGHTYFSPHFDFMKHILKSFNIFRSLNVMGASREHDVQPEISRLAS